MNFQTFLKENYSPPQKKELVALLNKYCIYESTRNIVNEFYIAVEAGGEENATVFLCTAVQNYIGVLVATVKKIKDEEEAAIAENEITKLGINLLSAYLKASETESAKNLRIIKHFLDKVKTGEDSFKKHFLVRKSDRLIPVYTSEIAGFFADEKTVAIISKHKEELFVNKSLDDLQCRLDPNEFFRANRQYMISRKYIKEIFNGYNYTLKIELSIPSKTVIVVSREKAGHFIDWFEK